MYSHDHNWNLLDTQLVFKENVWDDLRVKKNKKFICTPRTSKFNLWHATTLWSENINFLVEHISRGKINHQMLSLFRWHNVSWHLWTKTFFYPFIHNNYGLTKLWSTCGSQQTFFSPKAAVRPGQKPILSCSNYFFQSGTKRLHVIRVWLNNRSSHVDFNFTSRIHEWRLTWLQVSIQPHLISHLLQNKNKKRKKVETQITSLYVIWMFPWTFLW